ncbi:MAG: hypothetical protein RLP45_14390, partial [Haliea sp.]
LSTGGSGSKAAFSTDRFWLPYSAELNTIHPPTSDRFFELGFMWPPAIKRYFLLRLFCLYHAPLNTPNTSCYSHTSWRTVLSRSAPSFGVQMYGQPQCTGFTAFNPVRRARRKKKIIASTENSANSGNVHNGSALNQQYPLILRLYVLNRLDVGTADNALDHQVAVGEERVEALALSRRIEGFEKVRCGIPAHAHCSQW